MAQRSAPLLAGLGLLAAIAGALLSVDAFSPPRLPQGFSTQRELIGINLLLMLIPPYLLTCWMLADRRSRLLLERVDLLLGQPEFAEQVPTPWPQLMLGGGGGALYAIAFNLPIRSLTELLAGGPLLMVLVSCMILVWVAVGVTLTARIHAARLFRAAGRRVPIDLYHQAPLEPFARAGMGDLLLVVGALVLTTVQSIDATFRAENYLFALAVGVPAGLVLLLLPMASLHTRLKAAKRAELAALDARIGTASKVLVADAMDDLERLLRRRARASEAYTWPVNVAMVSRILLYGVIPPAAWVAAALVERFIETVLSG